MEIRVVAKIVVTNAKPPLKLSTIADIRKQTGLGKKAFADMMGVTAQTVHNWEIGRVVPHKSKVQQAMSYLKRKFDYENVEIEESGEEPTEDIEVTA